MMNSKNKKLYTPTPEQLSLSQARKEKKNQVAALVETSCGPGPSLLPRAWLNLDHHASPESSSSAHRVKILTWNLLAQCLIRRELFPTSDCLKASQRDPLINEEILRQDADILCLQEVDGLEKKLPVFEKAGYSYYFASGPRKKHGCLIAFKKQMYTLRSEKIIYYDEQNIGTGDEHTGATFKTKNIGSMVALTKNGDEQQGLIVATTHLFWHPRYTYERVRQVGILTREVSAFKEQLQVNHWPSIIAGDFNFTPSDPAYSLISGDDLLPTQEEMILPSMVIHASLDPTVSTNPAKAIQDNEEDVDPDRHITNARVATDEDGLLNVPNLVAWFSKMPRLRSMYNDGLRESRKLGVDIPLFRTRVALPAGRYGADELEYTSYTHYWQSVLDYIFVIDPLEKPVRVVGLLAPLTAEDMAPGLPQKRVSGSDHTCLVAELTW